MPHSLQFPPTRAVHLRVLGLPEAQPDRRCAGGLREMAGLHWMDQPAHSTTLDTLWIIPVSAVDFWKARATPGTMADCKASEHDCETSPCHITLIHSPACTAADEAAQGLMMSAAKDLATPDSSERRLIIAKRAKPRKHADSLLCLLVGLVMVLFIALVCHVYYCSTSVLNCLWCL